MYQNNVKCFVGVNNCQPNTDTIFLLACVCNSLEFCQ